MVKMIKTMVIRFLLSANRVINDMVRILHPFYLLFAASDYRLLHQLYFLSVSEITDACDSDYITRFYAFGDNNVVVHTVLSFYLRFFHRRGFWVEDKNIRCCFFITWSKGMKR